MTNEEFVALQLQHHQIGKSLKNFLQEAGLCYSKYNYWNRKCKADDTPYELAPIMFTEPKGNNYSVPRKLHGPSWTQVLAGKEYALEQDKTNSEYVLSKI